jgi:hypothetical protein
MLDEKTTMARVRLIALCATEPFSASCRLDISTSPNPLHQLEAMQHEFSL